MSKTKKIGLGVLIAFLAIQFFQPKENKSNLASAADISKLYPVPDSVLLLLKSACYDCHSNNTQYPWYSHIQPVAWVMASHVNDGKRELNFSDFGTYSSRKQISKLKGIANEVRDDQMPISSYKSMHSNARLSPDQKLLIITWADQKADSLQITNK